METEKVKELLHFYNPWWVQKGIPEELLPDYQRPVLDTLLSYLTLDRIIVIKGPRRTGKTTLMYQMAARLLENGIKPENIFFLSFDDPTARLDIDEITKIYQQLTRQVFSKQTTVYFFFDEIQFIDNWSFSIKRYFDRKLPIKFIVSGSAASLIKKGAESLAGRTVEEVILPFSFYEYLIYHLRDGKLIEVIDELRGVFNFSKLPARDMLIPYETQIKIILDDYLQSGGFPHLLKVKEKILRLKLLREDVIEKVIYRDLIELYQIKKPRVLENLFLYLASHSSELLNIANIANSLSLSREYTERYIDYLRESYLIFKCRAYSKAAETRIRRMEKCYVSDPGLMQVALSRSPGKTAETVVAGHLLDRMPVYWRNHNVEVDIVVEKNEMVVPIEVKYSDDIRVSDMKGLLKFLDVFKGEVGLLVTKNQLEERKIGDKMIFSIPVWLFLLLLKPGSRFESHEK
jgi:predicted AAA+ superfamily ATPase